MPVITLFFQENGLSLSEIFFLQSIFGIGMFVFEVPTWYFGDRIGRKWSVVIGVTLFALWFFVYSLGHSFLWFAGAETILALWSAFISGSDSALLYDSLKELGRQNEYKKMEWLATFVWEASWAVGGIIWGIAASAYGLRNTMLVTAILVWLAIPFAIMLKDIKQDNPNPDKSLWQNLIGIIRYAIHDNKTLKRILIYSAALSTATLSMVRWTQPYLTQLEVPIAWFGIIRFVLRWVVSLSGLAAHWWDKKLWLKTGLASLLILVVAGYILVWTMWSIVWWFIWLLLFQIERGIQKPFTNHAINELTESYMRATVLSVNSMIGRIMRSVLGPVLGWMADFWSLQTMFLLSALLFGVMWGVCMLNLVRVKKLQ